MFTPKLTPVFAGTIDGREVRLELAAPTIARLRVAGKETLGPEHSYAIAPQEFPPVQVTVHQHGGVVTAKTESLTLTLSLDPLGLKVEDRYGFVRFETASPALRAFAFPKSTDHADGMEPGLALHYRTSAGERAYGMGETGETLDKMGRRYIHWNTDDPAHHPHQHFYSQIPFLLHQPQGATGPYAVFLDNPGMTAVDLRTEADLTAAIGARDGDLALWVLVADTVPEVLQLWGRLTGPMERPPLWALGYHQCRWSYTPDARVREVADEFRRRRIPCDAIYLDIDYMDGYRVFTWDPKRFPEPKKLLAGLKADGFHTVAIVDPGVKVDADYGVYEDFLARESFFLRRKDADEPHTGKVWPGDSHYPDFTKPEARARWGEYQRKALLDFGIDGIWNDMNEPSDWDGRRKTIPDDIVHEDGGAGRSHQELHQVYGLTMARASHEGFLRARPDLRPFIITRAGWAGVQRHAMQWTGDNTSTWSSMRLDVQTNLSMAMTGIAFVGCDIGGFWSDADPELFTRWIEWGVFQPFCRAHSCTGTANHEPWAFGEAVERIARRMIEARMRLLPYLYTAFVESAETATPIKRPLLYDYANDATTHRIADQWMLGPDLLIAPVLDPGVDRRMLYLPPGDWIHYWSGIRAEGARWVLWEAPYGHPPVFARAGAIIPHAPVRQHTGGPLESIALDIYPGAQLEGRLVLDDGATRAFERGEEARYEFTGSETEDSLQLLVPAPQGSFAVPHGRWVLRLHRGDRAIARVDGNGEPLEFEQRGMVAEWSVPNTGEPWEFFVAYER